jgi:hypothetical protein
VRSVRRGREREIKEMGVESGERRGVQGLLITSAHKRRKIYLGRRRRKDEGRGVNEKK